MYLGKMAKAFYSLFLPRQFIPYFSPAAPKAISCLGSGPKSKYLNIFLKKQQNLGESVPLKTLWPIKLLLGIVYFLYLCHQLIRNVPSSLGVGRCPARRNIIRGK